MCVTRRQALLRAHLSVFRRLTFNVCCVDPPVDMISGTRMRFVASTL